MADTQEGPMPDPDFIRHPAPGTQPSDHLTPARLPPESTLFVPEGCPDEIASAVDRVLRDFITQRHINMQASLPSGTPITTVKTANLAPEMDDELLATVIRYLIHRSHWMTRVDGVTRPIRVGGVLLNARGHRELPKLLTRAAA